MFYSKGGATFIEAPQTGICHGTFEIHLVFFSIDLKHKNVVEEVDVLLSVKFRLILLRGFTEEVENISANLRPGGHFVFPITPKTQL